MKRFLTILCLLTLTAGVILPTACCCATAQASGEQKAAEGTEKMASGCPRCRASRSSQPSRPTGRPHECQCKVAVGANLMLPPSPVVINSAPLTRTAIDEMTLTESTSFEVMRPERGVTNRTIPLNVLLCCWLA